MTITKNKIIMVNLQAEVFEKAKMSNMSNSDRVAASREAKRLVLKYTKFIRKQKKQSNGCIRSGLTIKIDIRLKGRFCVYTKWFDIYTNPF
jgi:RecB family exonuclease